MTRTLMLLALLTLACGTGSRSAVLYQVNAGEGSDQDYETEPDTLVLSGPDTWLEPEQDTPSIPTPGSDTKIGPDAQTEPDTQIEPEPDAQEPCIAQCDFLECGPDPICGFNCGDCDPLRECVKSKCLGVQECGTAFTEEPQCKPGTGQTSYENSTWVVWCQDDLPHGLNCYPPFFCGFDPKKGKNGCITDPPCVPFCGPVGYEGNLHMMECGDDGCYNVCGECPWGTYCGGEGLCEE